MITLKKDSQKCLCECHIIKVDFEILMSIYWWHTYIYGRITILYCDVQLHVMSEKLCAGRELKDQTCANLSQIIPICTDTPTLNDVHPMFVVTNALTATGRLEERTVDSACNTPLLFSSKIRTMSNRESKSSDSRSAEESCVRRLDSKQNEIKPKVDWVEQYQPGVYITFTTLPSGQKGLKRVRFR